METITRFITIITEQKGYMLNAGDCLAVSDICYSIALILFVIAIVIHSVMTRKEEVEITARKEKLENY